METEEGEVVEDQREEEEDEEQEGDEETSDAEGAAADFLAAAQRQLNLQFRPRVVLPGDDVTADVSYSERVRLGSGLVQVPKGIKASKAGLLRYQTPNIYRVDNYQRRVSPVPCP